MKKKWKVALLLCFVLVSVAFVSQRIISKQGDTILSENKFKILCRNNILEKLKA